MDLTFKQIETEDELQKVLELCYRVLGEWNNELYGYDAWRERWKDGLQPLVYAMKDGHVVSAVLGRAENKDSLIIGFVACHEQYRRQGITQRLMDYFETLAKEKGFRKVAEPFLYWCIYETLRDQTPSLAQRILSTSERL